MENRKNIKDRLKQILDGFIIVQKNINHLIDETKQLLKRIDK